MAKAYRRYHNSRGKFEFQTTFFHGAWFKIIEYQSIMDTVYYVEKISSTLLYIVINDYRLDGLDAGLDRLVALSRNYL